jgi:predicted ester cyclase
MATTPSMPMMKPERTTNNNSQTVRDFLVALDRKQGIPTEFLTKDMVFVFNGDQPTNSAGWQKLSEFWFGAFAGSKHTVDYVVAEGNRTYARLRAKGIHNGPFGELPATRKPIDIVGAACFEFRDGKIARAEVIWDMLTCMKQIGAIPA